MKLCIRAVGRSSCRWATLATEQYAPRIQHSFALRQEWVKTQAFKGDAEHVKQQEGKRLLKGLSARERLIALDERGLAVDTQGFSKLIGDLQLQGVTEVVFVIGGAYGLSDEVRKKAHKTLQLSSLVLNHEVARVVLIEQLYRALTLLKGIPYHH